MGKILATALLLVAVARSVSGQTPALEVSIAANNGPGALNYAGWPVELIGTIALDLDNTSYLLRPAQISLAIYDSTGAKLEIAPAAIAVPTADVTLSDDNDLATLRYSLSPEQTSALAGKYTFELTVGEFKARTTIQLTTPPDPLPGELVTPRRLAFADYFLATGNPQAALDLMNQELAVAPKFLPAMTRAATALERLDRRNEAMQLLSDAIDATQAQNPDATHPPRELIRRYRNLLLAITGVKPQ